MKANGLTKCICEHTSLQNKSNAYIHWTTKNIISKFKESNFDSKPTTFTTVTKKMALRKMTPKTLTYVKLIITVSNNTVKFVTVQGNEKEQSFNSNFLK